MIPCLLSAQQVVDAFADFNLPGRFCKRVKHVTRSQFSTYIFLVSERCYVTVLVSPKLLSFYSMQQT
jgi:hypothetical protein